MLILALMIVFLATVSLLAFAFSTLCLFFIFFSLLLEMSYDDNESDTFLVSGMSGMPDDSDR